MPIAWIISTFAIAYGLGSIPFGLLLSRLAGLGDIRRIGSGNIGATNVMRSGHKSLALLTLLLDAGKGFAAVALVRIIYPHDLIPIAGLFVVLGHIFPVWLRFKGGKGVATTIGVLLALDPLLGACVCGMWLLTFIISRISSLSSLMAMGYSPIVAYLLDNYLTGAICLSLAALILFTHRSNIRRLWEGNEHVFRSSAA